MQHKSTIALLLTTTTMVAIAFIGTVHALPPSQSYGRVHFYEMIMPNMTAEMAVFTLGFNQQIQMKGITSIPVYLKDPSLNGTLKSYSAVDGVLIKTVPLLLSGTGAAYLKCKQLDDSIKTFLPMTESQLSNALIGGAQDPTGLLMLHPTADPAVSMTSMFGGLTYPHLEWQQDQLSFGLLMNGTRYVNGAWTPFTNQNVDVWQLTRAGGCWFVFGNSKTDAINTKTIVNADSTKDPLPYGSYWFNQTDMRCTPQGVERARKARIFHEEQLNKVTVKEQFIQWLKSAHSFSLFECWVGCPSLADLLYTPSELAQLVNQTLGCEYMEGTPQYLADPCCNDALAFSAACVPKTLNITYHPVNQYHIPKTITDPAKQKLLKLAINSYASIRHFAEFDSLHQNADDRSTAVKFPETQQQFELIHDQLNACEDEVRAFGLRYYTDCHVDTDCKFTGQCDQSSSPQKKCKVPRDDSLKTIAACIHEVSDETYRVIQFLKGIPSAPADALRKTIQNLANIVDKFVPVTLASNIKPSPLHFTPPITNLTQAECIGPHSATCRSNFTVTVDGYNNFIVVEKPANKSCCLTVGKQCNWNARGITDKPTCEGQTTDHFCGIRDGNSQDYTEIGHPPGCIATAFNTSADCSTIGGYTWYTQPDGYAACFRTETTLGDCLGTADSIPPCSAQAVAITAALTSGNYRTDDATMVDHPLCGLNMCYTTSLSSAQCNTLRTTATTGWHSGDPFIKVKAGIYPVTSKVGGVDTTFCTASLHHFSLYQQNAHLCDQITGNFSETRGTWVYHQGRAFRPGQWDTRDSCLANGKCGVGSLDQFGTDESTCRSAQLCPHSCSRCVSPRKGRTGQAEKGLCYDTAALAENACLSPGVWRNYTTAPALLGGSSQIHGVCEYPAESLVACVVNLQNALVGRSAGDLAFISCSDLTSQSDCQTAGPSSNKYTFSWMYKALQCQWDTHQTCRTPSECEAEQRCDDEELELCTCTPGLLCSCSGGACIETWHLDPATGARNKCLLGNNNFRTTKVGCMDMTTTTNATCQAKGGYWQWFPKAHTKGDCDAHGFGCYALSSHDQNPGDDLLGRPDSECQSGGSGNITYHYRWLTGSADLTSDTTVGLWDAKANVPRLPQTLKRDVMERTKWQTTEWVPRTWVPSGVFTDSIGSSSFHQFAGQVAARIAGSQMQRRITQHFGRIIPIMAQIAAANATADTGCGGDCLQSIITHHPFHLNTPGTIHQLVQEQTALVIGPTCTKNPDPDCASPIPGVFVNGKPVQKRCEFCGMKTPIGDTCDPKTKVCEFLVSILIPCTCTISCCKIECPPLPGTCGCVEDDGTPYDPRKDAQYAPIGLLCEELDPGTGVQLHQAMAFSTVVSSVVAADPVKVALGGNECLTDEQVNDQCILLTVIECNNLKEGNHLTCVGVGLATTHTVFGSQVLANFGGWLATTRVAPVLAALTFTDVDFENGLSDYAVIHNSGPTSRIVGQIIGDCIIVHADQSNQFPAFIAAPLDNLIAQDNTRFPVPDFCSNSYSMGPPLDSTVSVNGTHIYGIIRQIGWYCPCIHEVNWRTNPINHIDDMTQKLIIGLVIGILATGATIMGLINVCSSNGVSYAVVKQT